MRDMRRTESKRRAERRGRRGELIASLMLLVKGYRILGRRVRTPLGEIDLVAQTPGGVVCFIEVKTRDTIEDAVEALLPRQQARIARAAETFLAKNPYLRPRGVRFDTITVTRGRLPRHFRMPGGREQPNLR
jgi:putative endonuclease